MFLEYFLLCLLLFSSICFVTANTLDTMETSDNSESEPSIAIAISSNDSSISLSTEGAVQELQSALQSISNQAGLQSAESQFPKLFYTSSVEEANQVIDSYEMKTNSKFIVYKESKYFGQNVPLHIMACQNKGKDGKSCCQNRRFLVALFWEGVKLVVHQ